MKHRSPKTSTAPSKPTANRLKVAWLQGITCNGNTHSFLNADALPALLEKIEFLYHPSLPSRYGLEQFLAELPACDVVIVEGAMQEGFERAGRSIVAAVAALARKATAVIAAGSCASFGGMFRLGDPESIGGIAFDGDSSGGRIPALASTVINLPGCPLHPEWLVMTLELIIAGKPVVLDEYRRPRELYAPLVHHGCLRNEYFEWKVDSKGFGVKEGCLFYGQGCRGPMTHGSCNKILWNGVSSKTRTGMPCIGCTEPDFPRSDFFKTVTHMSIPREVPLGVPKRAYLTLTGMAKAFTIDRLEKRLLDD